MARPRNTAKDAEFLATLFGWALYSRHKVTNPGTSQERYKAFDFSASTLRYFGNLPEQIWRKTFCMLVPGGPHKNEDGTTEYHLSKWILNSEAADYICEIYSQASVKGVNPTIPELMAGLANMRQLEWRAGMIFVIYKRPFISHDKEGNLYFKRQKKKFYTKEQYSEIKIHNKQLIDAYKKKNCLD